MGTSPNARGINNGIALQCGGLRHPHRHNHKLPNVFQRKEDVYLMQGIVLVMHTIDRTADPATPESSAGLSIEGTIGFEESPDLRSVAVNHQQRPRLTHTTPRVSSDTPLTRYGGIRNCASPDRDVVSSRGLRSRFPGL